MHHTSNMERMDIVKDAFICPDMMTTYSILLNQHHHFFKKGAEAILSSIEHT